MLRKTQIYSYCGKNQELRVVHDTKQFLQQIKGQAFHTVEIRSDFIPQFYFGMLVLKFLHSILLIKELDKYLKMNFLKLLTL